MPGFITPTNWRRFWLPLLASLILGLVTGLALKSALYRSTPVAPPPAATAAPLSPAPAPLANTGVPPPGMALAQFEAAIRKALASPLQERRAEALTDLAESIDAEDIPQLAPRLTRHPNTEVGRHLANRLFQRWAASNPPAAWACAQTIALPARRLAAQSAILVSWARKDAAAALGKINQTTRGVENTVLKTALLEALAEVDPKRAMALASASGSSSKALQCAVLLRWAEKDPGGAAALAAWPGQDIEVLAAIAQAWAVRDPAAALAWVKTLTGMNPLGTHAGGLILAIAWTNPALAADYLRSMPKGPLRNRIMRQQAYVMGLYDLQAAAQWVEQFPDDAGKREALVAVVREWAQFAPQEAITCTALLPEGAQRRQVLADVAKIWVKADPAAACAWVAKQPETEDRTKLLSELARAWARQAPADAAAFVAGLPGGPLQEEAVAIVLASWTEVDPKAAVSWVSQFPEGVAREKSICSVIDTWAKADPEAVGQWIHTFPAGASRDTALTAYVERLTQSHDPEKAMTWAQSIKDESLRVKTMTATARTWLYRDAAPARAWVERSSLPEASKRELLPPQQ